MRSTIVKAPQYTDLGGMAAMFSQNLGAVGAGYGGPTNSQFGPGIPPLPRPIGGDPRLYQLRPGYNLPTLPGEGRLVDYKTLRAVAKLDPFVRKAIEVRKDQMTNLTIDLIARDRKDARKARETVKARQAKIDEVKRWMDCPDGRNDWGTWLAMILEDHIVVDGVALNKRRNLDPDAGPVSTATFKPMGKLLWLEQIDATTIKPLRDSSGREPLPPLDAYQQFLYGLPVFGWTKEEFIYAVKSPAPDSNGYGFSSVEMFLTLINLNLRYWSSMNAIYTDGTLPEGIVTAPEGWTPQQISSFADNWNRALAGDPRALRKLHMAPHGVGWIAFKEHVFDKELARFLVDILAMAMDLTPSELGFEPQNKGLGGKGYSENQERLTQRRGTGTTFRFLANAILNPLLWSEWGLTDLEFAAVDLDEQDEESRAKADDLDLRNGRISLDELVERDGGTPPGVGRFFVVGQNLVLGEPDLIKLTTEGAAALGLLQPAKLDEDGMPMPPTPPPAIGPDGKPLVDPKTGEPLQHPTLGPDGTPLKLPMDEGTGKPAPQPEPGASNKPFGGKPVAKAKPLSGVFRMSTGTYVARVKGEIVYMGPSEAEANKAYEAKTDTTVFPAEVSEEIPEPATETWMNVETGETRDVAKKLKAGRVLSDFGKKSLMENPTVIFMRHGEIPAIAHGLMHGQDMNKLDPKGVKQVGLDAELMAKWPIDRVYASDLPRAMQTAEIVTKDRNLEIVPTQELRTWDIGDFDGKEKTDENEAARKDYMRNQDEVIPGGEAFGAFLNRLIPEFRKILDERQQLGPGITLAVCHEDVIQTAEAWISTGIENDRIEGDAFTDEPNTDPGDGKIFEYVDGRWMCFDDKDASEPKKVAWTPEAMLDDLRRWELKSMRSLRRGKSAAVKFASDFIPSDLAARITERLTSAVQPEQVKAAFIDSSLTLAVRKATSPLADVKVEEAIAELTKSVKALVDQGSTPVYVRVKPPKVKVNVPDVIVPEIQIPEQPIRVVPFALPKAEKVATPTKKTTRIVERDESGAPKVIETVEE